MILPPCTPAHAHIDDMVGWANGIFVMRSTTITVLPKSLEPSQRLQQSVIVTLVRRLMAHRVHTSPIKPAPIWLRGVSAALHRPIGFRQSGQGEIKSKPTLTKIPTAHGFLWWFWRRFRLFAPSSFNCCNTPSLRQSIVWPFRQRYGRWLRHGERFRLGVSRDRHRRWHRQGIWQASSRTMLLYGAVTAFHIRQHPFKWHCFGGFAPRSSTKFKKSFCLYQSRKMTSLCFLSSCCQGASISMP